MSDRKCGACTLCCTALAVPELNKPNGVRCKHLTSTGCGIYEDRPPSCQVFECAWLQGAGDGLHTRPDYTGGVMIPERDTGPDDLGTALVIYLVEGKKVSKYVEKVIQRVLDGNETVFLVMGDQRRCLTSANSDYAKKVEKLMAEGRTPSER